MQWSPQQDAALRAIAKWLKVPADQSQVFYLAGYAGTGKTTLAKNVAEAEDLTTKYAAFTGKAALVMQRNGCHGASTIHRLIYKMQNKSESALHEMEARLQVLVKQNEPPQAHISRELHDLQHRIARERDSLRQPGFKLKDGPVSWRDDATGEEMSDYDDGPWGADLITIDECSMVDEGMGEDLLSFGKKVLVIGDPAQLPPVGGGGFFTRRQPDIMLTEIHRQARDNPIIDLATQVREGRNINIGNYGESMVVERAKVPPERILQADQVLVGMNKTRKEWNARFRLRRGAQTPLPEPGDKLICLKNNHELRLLNGSLWTTKEYIPSNPAKGIITARSLDDGETEVSCDTWTCHFLGHQPGTWHERAETEEFDYGYAITVHKSQGSQWDAVCLVDEWHRQNRQEWLYTGLTRAAGKVTVVR